MTQSVLHLKTGLLAVAIAVGMIVQCSMARAADTATAYLAGGCFWCIESDFEKVKGVSAVVSGYTGGHAENPTYRDVVRGGTGHYEAVEITYDPGQISYAQILHLFLRSVDPTDPGGQFCDRGESYRTAIFVQNGTERALAEQALARAEADLGQRIVTPVLEAGTFHIAEEYHQDYYKKDEIVLTRRGPKSKAAAYTFYRQSCGRDQRVRELWGRAAPFTG